MGEHIKTELSPWMSAVYVSPEYRGKGIGTLLCQRILEELKRLKVKEAYLYTADQVQLYAKLGWIPFDKVEYKGEMQTIMKYSFSK